MIQNTIDSLEYTIKSCESLFNKEEIIKGNLVALQNELKEKENYLQFLKGAKEKYTTVVNELYEESIVALKDTLNTALKYIILDKNYSINIILEDKKGSKSLSFLLIDEDNGFEVDLKDGVGQGVRTIISFVLKTYYLLNQNSKILFLDEKYSALSSHYIPRFYEFMKKFCDENDFIIVMISHIDSQIEYADKIYYLNDGVISEENNLTKGATNSTI